DIIQGLLDGALVLRRVLVIAVLRSSGLENPFALLDAFLYLLALACIGRRDSFAGSFPVLLAIAQRLELVSERFHFRPEAVLLLIDFLRATPRIGLGRRVLTQLLRLVCDLLLLLGQLLRLLLCAGKTFFHGTVSALTQQA